MLTFIAVVVGLILGSFLSVLLARLPEGKEGIVAGRSECPHCRHTLAWYDLLPLASYAILLGRCRYCEAKISFFYPALEAAMASVLGLYVYLYGIPTAWFLTDLFILFGLVALFFFDLRHQILPDVITYSLSGVALLRIILIRPDLLVNSLAMGVMLTAALGILYIVSRGRWLGLGDVKMAAFVGLMFGYPGAVGVTLLAVWAGALVGLGMIILRKASMKTALPFGSFWAIAAIVAMFLPGPVFFLSGLFTPVL